MDLTDNSGYKNYILNMIMNDNSKEAGLFFITLKSNINHKFVEF